MSDMGLLQTYKACLPIHDNTPLLTLQEGNTPPVCAQHLSNELDLDLCFKFEALPDRRYEAEAGRRF